MELLTGREAARPSFHDDSTRIEANSPSDDASIWSVSGTPKYSRHGVIRTVPPSETVRRVAPLMGVIGVSRVAEVTHLDRNGLPNFIAARPREAGAGISYYNGKGASRSQARASAMMEAIERFSAESCVQRPILRSYEGLKREASAIDPGELIVPRLAKYDPGVEIEWVRGFDLIGRRPTYVPLNIVVSPYLPQRGVKFIFASTNGLASGNTREEALCQALCEINERDAFSLYEASTTLKAQMRSLFAKVGIPDPPAPPGAEYPLIDPTTLPHRLMRVYRRLEAGGLSVYLRDVTSETRIATFKCVVSERRGPDRSLSHAGYGSHPDARVAALRALTEAAQSRVGFIQGGREDLPDLVRDDNFAPDPEQAFGSGPRIPFADVPTVEHASVGADVTWVLGRFEAVGLDQVVAVDLTRKELGIPVVRVVVPRAETWAIYEMHFSSGTIGPRALAKLH